VISTRGGVFSCLRSGSLPHAGDKRILVDTNPRLHLISSKSENFTLFMHAVKHERVFDIQKSHMAILFLGL
jgi:hypothetical protein